MKDKKSNESRRKLLKSIAAGSGVVVVGKSLPKSWSRPVVDSVMLPAHALTSGYTIYTGAALPGTRREASLSPFKQEGLLANLADSVLPVANAGAPPRVGNSGFFVCAMVDGGMAVVAVAGLGGEVSPGETLLIRRGTLNINGDEGTITASGNDISNCRDTSGGALTRPARIDSVNDVLVLQIATREFEGGFVEIIVPGADACVPEPPVCVD